MMPASNQGVGENIGFPDVCNTPVGPATAPLPYPNMGSNSMAMPFCPTLLVSMMPAHNQGANAQGIAKSDDTVIDHQSHGGIAAATALVHRGDRREYVLGGWAQLAQGLQFVGEDIEQYLGVRVGIEVAQIVLEQFLRQLLGIGQVAVVCQGDTVGGVHIERLGQGCAGAARGRVAHVADADSAAQHLHMVLAKHVPHQALALALGKPTAAAGHDPRGVLAAMLQHRQRIVNLGGNIGFPNHSNQATHRLNTSSQFNSASQLGQLPAGIVKQ